MILLAIQVQDSCSSKINLNWAISLFYCLHTVIHSRKEETDSPILVRHFRFAQACTDLCQTHMGFCIFQNNTILDCFLYCRIILPFRKLETQVIDTSGNKIRILFLFGLARVDWRKNLELGFKEGHTWLLWSE